MEDGGGIDESVAKPRLESGFRSRRAAMLGLFFARNWDWAGAALYAVALLAFAVPELKWNYDLGHDSGLLMSSLRIWSGQVPYRDFYPWYGPLYHYLLALFLGIFGNNLYWLKAYTDIVNPLLCMLILVLILRCSGMTLPARIFTMAAAPLFHLERIYYCGSLRSFLPVLAIAAWNQVHSSRRLKYFSLIFPSAFLLFFFSPEAGIYLLPPAMIFVLFAAVLERNRESRIAVAAWTGAGILGCVLVFAALYWRAQWFREYVFYVRHMTGNFRWAWGMSLPALWPINKYFDQFLYSPLLIYALAGISMIWTRFRGKEWPKQVLWSASILIFGLMIWYSAAMRFSQTHLQFAFLPAVLLAATALPGKFRPVTARVVGSGLALSALLVIGGLLFKSNLEPGFHGADYKMFLGVRIAPENWMSLEKARLFAGEHPNEVIAFPLNSFYYLVAGRRPDFKYDTLGWPIYPGYQADFINALRKLDARYLVLSEFDNSWLTPGEAIDPVMDYIDENYEEIYVGRPLRVYQKRPTPASIIGIRMEYHRNEVLDRNNSYTMEFMVGEEDISTSDFIDFQAEFHYQPEFLRRFSLPIIQFYFDGRGWKYEHAQSGRQRINTSPGPHFYRAYFNYPAKRIMMTISFPGALNFSPERIVVRDLKLLGCVTDCSPRCTPYRLE